MAFKLDCIIFSIFQFSSLCAIAYSLDKLVFDIALPSVFKLREIEESYILLIG
jgi:hypothetical protein